MGPSVLSMVSIFLFTVVDGIFTGRGVGEDALGAVNIAFPYVMIFSAVIMLATVGGLTVTAIRFGRGEIESANNSFMHSFVLTVIIAAVFTFIGTVLVEPLSILLGANDTYMEMTRDYIFWYAVFMIPCGLCTTLGGFARNDGNPMLVMIGTVVATALNIFGDWFLMFPMHMGIKGAAIATGVSQTVGFFIALSHFILKKGNLHFAKFRFDAELLKKILVRGMPECVSQFNTPVTTIVMNKMIIALMGDMAVMAVNAYSVIGYVAAFSVAVFAGTAEGLQPLFGGCYGAKDEKDLKWYFRTGLVIGFAGAVIIYVILLFVGRPICELYALEWETLEYTMQTMPIYSLGFLVQPFTTIISSYLYSTTRTGHALTINILKSFVLNTLVIIAIPLLVDAEMIWYGFAIYELIVLAAAATLLKKADADGSIGSALE